MAEVPSSSKLASPQVIICRFAKLRECQVPRKLSPKSHPVVIENPSLWEGFVRRATATKVLSPKLEIRNNIEIRNSKWPFLDSRFRGNDIWKEGMVCGEWLAIRLCRNSVRSVVLFKQARATIKGGVIYGTTRGQPAADGDDATQH